MAKEDGTAHKTVDVVTPAAGESVTEGTILEWHVKVGDSIKLDDTIVEISTDKVDVELPSPASGTVAEILVEEGDTVTVGQVIARIAVGAGATATSSPDDGPTRAAGIPSSGSVPEIGRASCRDTVQTSGPAATSEEEVSPAAGGAVSGGAKTQQ